jgi:hypothetical protein
MDNFLFVHILDELEEAEKMEKEYLFSISAPSWDLGKGSNTLTGLSITVQSRQKSNGS